MKRIITILFFLVILIIPSIAQTDTIPTISTDRPTQTTSPYFIPKGAFQIETGVIYTRRTDDFDERQMMSIGNSNLRYGVFENFEVNVMGSFESMTINPKEKGNDSTLSGLGGVSAGFKTFVCKEKGIRPALAIVGIIALRHLGNENFAPTFSYPLGKLAATHTLSNRASLGYNIGFSYSGEDADGFFIYSVYMGYYITSKLWSFIEGYGNFDNGNFPNHRADLGLTYLISPTFQLDISGGTGFSNDVDRSFISAGLSWRVNK
ncbi:MAG: transporter [Bacteroidetes bacterium]|nr:transporter [Bacteroidota bacterium]